MYAAQLSARYREIGLRLRPQPKPTMILVRKPKLPRFVFVHSEERHIASAPAKLKINVELLSALSDASLVSTRLTVARIVAEVARHYGVSVINILSASRTGNIIIPRHVAMYLAREHTVLSLPQISQRIGRKDHTTALFAWRKIGALRLSDIYLAAKIDNIKFDLGVLD